MKAFTVSKKTVQIVPYFLVLSTSLNDAYLTAWAALRHAQGSR